MAPSDKARADALDADPDRDDSFKRVLVLGKVMDILNLFTLDEPELDLKQIRQGSGLPNSTCVRLVRNMRNDGLLIQVGNKIPDRYRRHALGRRSTPGSKSRRDG